MNNVDLVLENGQIVQLEIPDQYFDDAMQAITQTAARKDFFSVLRFDGISCEYMGHSLERINMALVVGIM